MSMQEQTHAGQSRRFKLFVAIGDNNGQIGFGGKYSKDVATATRTAIILGKFSMLPARCVRLIPALRGNGYSGSQKLLMMDDIVDCYTSTRGSTGTLRNFENVTYAVVAKIYAYLTPDL
uniref:S5 DRBM domain-containing protein n=1 Tax=Glossina palpalis gambiensis TaxID=67801 RepID=A0A1B0BTF1_9MUSC